MIPPRVSVAVEGQVDVAVINRLCAASGVEISPIYNTHGVANLDRRLNGYNNAARLQPWLILRDLDQAECAPVLCRQLLPVPAEHLCLRIAVREVEAWLLADREGIAGFLSVSPANIPAAPEDLGDPKSLLIEVAGRSRRRDIRKDFVPRPESGRRVRPGYVAMMTEFVNERWNPELARARSASLDRTMHRLERFSDIRRWW